MSTPRKRWFKVADSILREDWDDATLATIMRLMAWLNQRRARDGVEYAEAGSAEICDLDAMAITRKFRADRARVALESLGTLAGLRTYKAEISERHGVYFVALEWPNYAEFQRPESRNRGAARAVDGQSGARSGSGSGSGSDLRTPTPFSSTEAAPPPTPKRAPRKQAGTVAPDRLAEESIQALEQWTRQHLSSELPHVRAHIEACLDYFRANGKPMADWVATCRNWIRRAPEMRRQPRGAPAPPMAKAKPSHEENMAAARKWREEAAERRSLGNR